MKRVHEIPVFYETETEKMLDVLKKMNIDTSKCFICGEPIVKTERAPRVLWEKWDAWRHKRKFYDWNISGICKLGVICDKSLCLYKSLQKMDNDTDERILP